MSFLQRPEGKELSVEQTRERLSSYVYGNIIMLTVTIGVTPSAVEHGSAVLTAVATALTTYLAHVLAHLVGHRIGHEADDDPRETVGGVLRGAWPIATSGLVPAVLLAVAWLGWLPATWALTAASIILVGRIAGVGLLVQRLSGSKPSILALWSGIVTALVALVIVVLKVVFTH